jgi:dihydrodipicolinate synthase/N-acetylneuraminate lyase
MKRKLDFTYDNVSYEGLPEYVRALQDNGMHYIVILVRLAEITFP